jgi:hypothetical protein
MHRTYACTDDCEVKEDGWMLSGACVSASHVQDDKVRDRLQVNMFTWSCLP